MDEFRAKDLESKPLGFYTWTPALSAIFQQDRFLQRPLDQASTDDFGRALDETVDVRQAYDAFLRLSSRLTNPLEPPRPGDRGERPPFFPASRSHEVTLLEKLFFARPIPDGFDLMGELIRRIRSGDIDLEPTNESGWYDHQAWSLAPLVTPDRMPERTRLELGKRYRKHLEDSFRGAMALARETHVKQARGGYGGCSGPARPPIRIDPGLSVEPLPSLYSRRAACYRFVRSVLEEAFGLDALGSLHRLTTEGPATVGLAAELTWIEELFAGAAGAASRELGMPHADEESNRFATWRRGLGADRDVTRDARMMVPVFFDERRQRTKVWAFLGWRVTEVDAEYRVPPTVLGVEPARRADHLPILLG